MTEQTCPIFRFEVPVDDQWHAIAGCSRPLHVGCRKPGIVYRITGYDPTDYTLTLELNVDWRPGQKDDPHAETQP